VILAAGGSKLRKNSASQNRKSGDLTMQGISLSEAAHIAVLEVPQNITAQSSSTPINPAFSMKNYKHASVLVIAGAEATQDATTLLVYLCSSAAGANPIAIPFNYYFQAAGGAGNDVLSAAINNAPATGLVLAAGNWPASGLIVIEIDANELEGATGAPLGGSLGVDSYIGIGLGAPTAADFAAVVAVLTGARYANTASPSVTV
jgi:hypothetical protein